MVEYYPDAERAALNQWYNRLELGKKLGIEEAPYTPPAEHYPHQFLWDSCFAAIINARAGERWLEAARTELQTLVADPREDGFIPNMQFAPIGRKLDPERWWAFEKEAKGSNYTQPPILALATAETYYATLEQNPVEAKAFLRNMYPALKKFYSYFEKYRSNNPPLDMLIGVIHPHETGRDSDPTYDFIKRLRLPRSGPNALPAIDLANTAIDYASITAHGIKLRSAKGDLEKAREIFWVNDVMMNCMYADNLYQMADLAKELGEDEDERHFSQTAQKVEQQILDKMWFPEARGGRGAFYALDRDGNPILETSISNLFPLLLPNLREEQLEALLDQMDESFNTKYPLPSVATDSRSYDPHNQEKDRLWRGPFWMNVNWYLVERGLKTQINRLGVSNRLIDRCLKWEEKIVRPSKALLDTYGPWEHYDPETGAPQRLRVKNFAWSNLGYVMLRSPYVDLQRYKRPLPKQLSYKLSRELIF